jgi:predicted CXXCH cytochrome family protein
MRFVVRIVFALLAAGAAISISLDGSPKATETFGMHIGTTGIQDSCSVCHDKTSTSRLISESKALCLNCHQAIHSQSLKSYQHPDTGSISYPGLSCEGCHRIHKANGKPLLSKADPPLCYDCHGETQERGSHPVISFRDKYGNEKPVTDLKGKVVTCASHCHDVHGTDYEYLCPQEPGRELCITCHKEFGE